MLKAADDQVDDIDRQYQRGLITDDERYENVVQIWKETTQAVSRQDERSRSTLPVPSR